MVQCVMKVVREYDYPGLGDRLRQYRQSKKLTGKVVAKVAGISESQLNRIETEDVKALPWATLQSVLSALGIVLEDLIATDPGTSEPTAEPPQGQQ